MRFEHTKEEIKKVAAEQNYTANNVEKVIRLSYILHDLNTLPEFKGKLLLKGGTAINLLAFRELKRLSVDLDLDFSQNLSREEMLTERERINKTLVKYCADNGYSTSSRNNFTLDSLSLSYTTTTGSQDKIKLDINYHNRCHILDADTTEIAFPFSIREGTFPVAHVSTTELFAGKIKAFYERCKPRDIYDIYSLAKSNLLSSPEERKLLKRCIVLYSTLGNTDNPNLLNQDVKHILNMPFQDIKTQLLPMLHTNAGKYPKNEINQCVVNYLNKLMQLDEDEKQYIEQFYNGVYNPSLLFNADIAERLALHPVALRTQQQIREKQ